MQDDILTEAEQLLDGGDPDGAQQLLDCMTEYSGRRCYVQSKIFKARNWLNEERKQLQLAVKWEPENEQYKSSLAELENFAEGESQFKEVKKKKHLWENDGCCEACCEGSCLCCGEGLCQALCEGICGGCS